MNSLKKIYTSFFQFDPKITRIIYKQSLVGFRYFTIAALVGYAYMFYYNLTIDVCYINVFLRVVAIVSCILAFVAIKTLKIDKLPIVTNFFFIIIILAEIESQHHGSDAEFYVMRNWLAYPLIMLFHTFFYLGIPFYFILIWSVILLLYISRGLFFYPQINHPFIPVIMVFMYSSAMTLLSIFLNLFWFRVRYKTEYFNQRLKNTNRSLKEANEKALVEQNLRLEAEKQLALIQERQAIFTDLHDHLGAGLTDISILTEKIVPDLQKDKSLAKKLNKNVKSIIAKFRENLLNIEDKEILDKNFFQGINLILLRRYSNKNRRLKFQSDPELVSLLNGKTGESLQKNLLAVCLEIVTNDLKYGKGLSLWHFFLKNNLLKLKITANSVYKPNLKSAKKTGLGTENIIRRVKDIGGKVTMSLSGGKFQADITIPF